MKLYFKREAESDLGEGTAFMEVTDEWPTRQVETYGDAWRWGDEAHNEWLADQPLSVLGLQAEDQIDGNEFERRLLVLTLWDHDGALEVNPATGSVTKTTS